MLTRERKVSEQRFTSVIDLKGSKKMEGQQEHFCPQVYLGLSDEEGQIGVDGLRRRYYTARFQRDLVAGESFTTASRLVQDGVLPPNSSNTSADDGDGNVINVHLVDNMRKFNKERVTASPGQVPVRRDVFNYMLYGSADGGSSSAERSSSAVAFRDLRENPYVACTAYVVFGVYSSLNDINKAICDAFAQQAQPT